MAEQQRLALRATAADQTTEIDALSSDCVSLEEVLARVQACGEAVTVAQLDRWQRHGLLPERHQWHLPGRVGSASGYYVETIEQIIMLGRLRRTYRRLDDVAVAAWLAGAPIALATVRTSMASLIARTTSLPEKALALLRDPKTGDLVEPFDAADALVMQLPDIALRTIALPHRADRATVATRILEWWLGGTPLWAGSGGEAAAGLGEATPQELLGRAIRLEQSALANWLHVDPGQLVAGFDWWHTIGLGAVPDLPASVRGWTDAETAQVRDDIVSWQALWRALSAILPPDHGDVVLGELLDMADAPLDEVAILACGLVAARRSHWSAMLDMILDYSQSLVALVASATALSSEDTAVAQRAVWARLVAGPDLNEPREA